MIYDTCILYVCRYLPIETSPAPFPVLMVAGSVSGSISILKVDVSHDESGMSIIIVHYVCKQLLIFMLLVYMLKGERGYLPVDYECDWAENIAPGRESKASK